MKGVIRGKGDDPEQWEYSIDGKVVTRAEYKAAFPDKPLGPQTACFFPPLHSEALAVNPGKIKEAAADAQAKGVPVEFDKHGRPVFTSRKQRRDYLRAYGYRDNDGGYSD